MRTDRKGDKARITVYPPPPHFVGCPHVALESATLRGHRMTFSHSSKDPLRPPVSGGELANAMEFKHDVAEELVIGS